MASATIQTLTLTPYGVSVFTDIQRQKSFVTLFFRHEKAVREVALAFPGAVLDALTEAGLTAPKGLNIHWLPLAEPTRSANAPRFRCHVEVSVSPLLASDTDLLLWADALIGKQELIGKGASR